MNNLKTGLITFIFFGLYLSSSFVVAEKDPKISSWTSRSINDSVEHSLFAHKYILKKDIYNEKIFNQAWTELDCTPENRYETQGLRLIVRVNQHYSNYYFRVVGGDYRMRKYSDGRHVENGLQNSQGKFIIEVYESAYADTSLFNLELEVVEVKN